MTLFGNELHGCYFSGNVVTQLIISCLISNIILWDIIKLKAMINFDDANYLPQV